MSKQTKKNRKQPSVNSMNDQPQLKKNKWKWLWAVVVVFIIATLVVGIQLWSTSKKSQTSKIIQETHFVGDNNCADCHAEQTKAWQNSQHKKAMQHVSADTVLGDFNNATFAYNNIVSHFFTRDGKYFVNTDDFDGQLKDFEIQYTFGVYPLQQYLITMEDGRVQALSIAWDSRAKEEGGQRWMHLYPNERIDAHDELHWTKPSQNWNFMCADCHSTQLKKNYDAKSNTFSTKFEAINVGCEACHGPGSVHIDWAKAGATEKDNGLTTVFEKHKNIHWQHDDVTGKPQRTELRKNDNEIEVCAQCHSRRAQISEGYHAGKPFLDYYLPSLPLPPLYHIDGQQKDEVYNWGSFLQSRMYQAGVTCSDCHEPHTQKLRAQGNALCAQCHLPTKYDTPKHTHHEMNSAGSQCVNCHMPNSVYMVIDKRRDHSIRVPRPDLSVTTGAPNACNSCHNDKNAKWAADKVHEWLGRDAQGLQNHATAFHAAVQGEASAPDQLTAVVENVSSPTIAKAAAIELLGSIPSEQTLKTIENNINSPEALVRLAAVQALPALSPEDQLRLGSPQLSSSLKAIRIESARVLLPQANQIPEQYRDVFEKAVAEYEATLHYNEDRAESRVALGMLQAYRGNLMDAQTMLEKTIKAFPAFVPAYVNLADIERASGNEAATQKTLRAGIAKVPLDATLHFALGLSLIRAQQKAEAIESLQKATQLAPDNSQFAYVYAIGLFETGHKREAVAEINRAIKLHPNDTNLLQARDSFK